MIDLREGTMIVRRDSSMIETTLDGETLALDMESGECYGFNQTASAVWTMIESPVPFAQLVDRLTDAFDVPRGHCELTTLSLLQELHKDGLVKFTPSPAEPS